MLRFLRFALRRVVFLASWMDFQSIKVTFSRVITTAISVAVFFNVALLVSLVMAAASFLSPTAFGSSFVEYVKSYNLGLNLIGASEFARISYDSKADSSRGKNNCVEEGGQSRCVISAQSGGRSKTLGGIGFYLDHPFEKKGQNFFWKVDLSFALQILDGEYLKPAGASFDDTLETLTYSLRGFQVKPYVQIGFTPDGFPDFLVTGGPVGTLLAGTVSINGQKEKVNFVQRSKVSLIRAAHLTLEAVFLRHGEGALSLYWSRSQAESSVAAGSFYKGSVGEMSNFSASFVHKEVGFKWLLNWP